MARKPTRFWHAPQRALRNAQEKIFARVNVRDDIPKLEDVRVRLQLYLRAMYGESVIVESLAPPSQRGLVQRTLKRLALGREQTESIGEVNCIRLPASLPSPQTGISPLEQYRILAVHHAERMRRTSAQHARDVTSDLERDLYELAESAAIDAAIVENQPGLRTALQTARAESIAERRTPRFRTGIETRVEQMLRSAWSPANKEENSSSTNSTGTNIPIDQDAESNATWARRTAVALEVEFGRKAARDYRRAQEITLCQTTIKTTLPEESETALETELRQSNRELQQDEWNSQSRSMMSGSSSKHASSNTKGGQSREAKSDGKAESSDAESSRGREVDGDAVDGNETDDNSQSGSNNAQQDTGEQKSDDTGTSAAQQAGGGAGTPGATHSHNPVDDAMLATANTFHYPEWDWSLQKFTTAGTTVRVMPSTVESAEWGANMLQTHAREIHRARRQFEVLRSHRLRLRKQEQGDELDLEACVEAMVDKRMKVAIRDRLYSQVRPGRRELAITLLIDISGSTGKVIDGQQRVIDVERISALIASAAFDALGDDYNVIAFSSAGPSNVRVHTVKEFGEKNSPLVLQRIGALQPHGTTRLGAAVRHASAMLAAHPAPHRLLLILTDGKPHDYDWYFTDYAIQDSHHAIINARLQGIHPFCITVDTPDDNDYLAEIFGIGGYRVVSNPSQLSHALLLAVKRLLAGA